MSPLQTKKINKIVVLALCLILLLLGLFLVVSRTENKYVKYIQPAPQQIQPKISGWIAWWAEKSALELVQKHPGQIHTVSPVWFMVNRDLELEEVGSIDKVDAIKELKKGKIEIYPTLGSELSGQELSYFLNDNEKTEKLILKLVNSVDRLGVEGVDINLEAIKKEDRNKFTIFLTHLSKKLKEKKIKLSVTVHAQTEVVLWEGVEGHNLENIARVADEVRIMTYDEHTLDTQPGPIASFKWISDVAKYSLTKIPREKIVMGIPSYGYVWNEDASEGLQYDEFEKFLINKTYSTKRDSKSGELIVDGKDFSSWLSDSNAMNSKLNFLRSLGFNNFIIWHLGGMDEDFFEKIF